MPNPPTKKTAIAFIDGQNLWKAVEEAFGCAYPDYEVQSLARHFCQANGWDLVSTHFFTGVYEHAHNAKWSNFWADKTTSMQRKGIKVKTRKLKKREKKVILRDSTTQTIDTFQEKGIDVMIALEIVRATQEKRFDVLLLFSQDQDFAAAIEEMVRIARSQGRTVDAYSVIPSSSRRTNMHPVHGTKALCLDETTYKANLDMRTYAGFPTPVRTPPRP